MSDFGRLQELARGAGVQVNPPRNVTVPAVTPETAAVGGSLNCTMGTWSGEPTGYTYQWMRDGAVEAGTGADYTTVTDDAGHNLSCVVTAANDVGATAAPASNAVTVAAARAQPATAPVTVSATVSATTSTSGESRRK